MLSKLTLSNVQGIQTVFVNFQNLSRPTCVVNKNYVGVRNYAWSLWRKRHPCDSCRLAKVDIPPEIDHKCPIPPTPIRADKEALKKMDYKDVPGGTNYGTPYRRLQPCPHQIPVDHYESGLQRFLKKIGLSGLANMLGSKKRSPPSVATRESDDVPKSLAPAVVKQPEVEDGVVVTVLGANTLIGHYTAMLLKQCPCVKRLKLYACCPEMGPRNIYAIAQDLHHIDTRCIVQAFNCNEMETSVANSDIVVVLDSPAVLGDMSVDVRFARQAPLIRQYGRAIYHESPGAFVIVNASPVDCMVPLMAEVLKECGWFDSRKLMGSMSAQEMLASTLAARALALEPQHMRVPCVGGTEGETLVPLFSKALKHFEFAEHNADMMTQTVRLMPRRKGQNKRMCPMCNAELSEAYALAKLVNSVAHALMCVDIPIVPGYVETDSTHMVSPARYLAVDLKLNRKGILKKYDFPELMSAYELESLDIMWRILKARVDLATNWYHSCRAQELQGIESKICKEWDVPIYSDRFDKCATESVT